MRLSGRALTLVMLVSLSGCGQVDPVLMPVSMPDCIYQGPSSMREGQARVSLTLNGMGDASVDLVELTGDEGAADLERHLETGNGEWEHLPEYVGTVLELSLDSSQGLDGVDGAVSLTEGSYGLICVDRTEDPPTARVAGLITVKPG